MGKPGGKKLPPLTCADFRRVIELDGWRQVDGTKHLAFEHPTKPGKVNLAAKWTDVKPGSWVYRSVLQQAGLSKKEFLELYWS